MSSTVWVGDNQVSGRMSGVLVMKGAVWVSSTVWVGEKQFNGRTSGGMGMRSVVLDSRPR